MTKQEYIDFIKLELTANVLTLEITDDTIGKYVDNAVKEIQRYYDEPKYVTVPFSSCIDLTDFNSSAILKIYRTEGVGEQSNSLTSNTDPLYAQQYLMWGNGGEGMYNLNNYLINYATYTTMQQLRNTMSTDLSFKEDKRDKKLYINTSSRLSNVTIEFIPIIQSAEEITSDYWIDILKRLALATVKIGLGRLRTRFKQSNALWADDGDTMLAEGQEEIKELREKLRVNSIYFYPID